MRDLMNHVHPITAIPPTRVTDNTALVSAIIDTAGYGSLTFVPMIGTIADADATFAVTVEHGDAPNLSDAVAVPGDQLLGSLGLAGFTHADDGKTRKLGYVGYRQFVRITITPAGNGAAADVGVLAVLGHPAHMPTANPPT
ncbi:hypothetical protein [Azospirillum soli]|uniref:hypothetical protein n=1 Tax=Azospirillum soli TaxID=1304799 RepID=UPI001AE6EA67|nr:hypothetical protein [Azospirillum soli]MBP2315985.1 hypothetical protein [Azospirillum soli]